MQIKKYISNSKNVSQYHFLALKAGLISLLLLTLPLIISCNKQSTEDEEYFEEEVEDNVLIEYIKTPIDRANNTKKTVEDRDKKRLEQLDNF